MSKFQKILIIRLSSIGDIVLCSPVIRSLKQARPEAELHFLTKKAYISLLEHNPYISKLHLWEGDFQQTKKELAGENFDLILDLHHNLRSIRLSVALGVKSIRFPKQNLDKYLLVRFKWKLRPIRHVVERYGRVLESMNIELDQLGLELLYPPELDSKAAYILRKHHIRQPIAMVLGATHATKRWPSEHFIKLAELLQQPIVLLGGPDTVREAEFISEQIDLPVLNAAGKYSVLLSAAIMKQCRFVITHDTGMMHIAAAFGMRIYSLWGNTVPEFGMIPYRTPHEILQVEGLSCRPCSKIGHSQCPKKHFRCMNELTPNFVSNYIKLN